MAVRGAAVAYTAIGSLVLFSGIKGATIADTVKAVLGGSLNVQDTETVNFTSAASSSGAAAVNVQAGANQTQWNTDLLKALGAPATKANLASLADWESREEPTATWNHWNNPLNTTVGSGTSENSAGVKGFATLQDGLNATAQTIEQGNFEAIRLALLAGNGLQNAGGQVAAALSAWSGGGYSSV